MAQPRTEGIYAPDAAPDGDPRGDPRASRRLCRRSLPPVRGVTGDDPAGPARAAGKSPDLDIPPTVAQDRSTTGTNSLPHPAWPSREPRESMLPTQRRMAILAEIRED